jgi:DNA-binding response OmpR family regulator
LSIALQLSNDSGLVVCVGDTGAPPFDTATPINKLSSPFLPGVDVRANAATGGAKQIHVGDMTLNPSHHEVKVKGRICAGLTPMEYEILHLLARNAGMLFSRNDILAAMQSDNRAISNRSVDIHIYGIRKKIGAAASYVQTVRGYGYRVCA